MVNEMRDAIILFLSKLPNISRICEFQLFTKFCLNFSRHLTWLVSSHLISSCVSRVSAISKEQKSLNSPPCHSMYTRWKWPLCGHINLFAKITFVQLTVLVVSIPVLSNYDKQLFRLSIFSAFSGKTRFFINLSAFSLSLTAAEGCTLRVFNVIDRSPAIKVRIVSDLGNLKAIII